MIFCQVGFVSVLQAILGHWICGPSAFSAVAASQVICLANTQKFKQFCNISLRYSLHSIEGSVFNWCLKCCLFVYCCCCGKKGFKSHEQIWVTSISQYLLGEIICFQENWPHPQQVIQYFLRGFNSLCSEMRSRL